LIVSAVRCRILKRKHRINTPFVSVIIPAYNYERFIAEAVESVKQKDYKPIEIIIIDNGFTGGTLS
jgi:glycosyltransferase involved in cell wall biosynthesis